jgi:hypothetical protein
VKGDIMLKLVCAFAVGLLLGVHSRVIKSAITGSEMPKAPKWHCWVKKENRRA